MGHRDIVFLGRLGATYSITDRYFCTQFQRNA
jgi:hypothetical protein